MSTTRAFDIIIWEATGFTGKLVVEHLYKNYGINKSLKWAIAGRSQAKLEAVRTEWADDNLPFILGDRFIITKKNKEQGFSGSVSGSVSTNEQYRSGLALSNGLGKVNLSLNLNYSERERDANNQRSRISDALNYTQIGDNLFDGFESGATE